MHGERKAFSNSDGKEPQPKQKRKKHFKNKMHLWEFLFELLADHQCRSFITWTRREKGEFRIIKTEQVAKLWGLEKGRQGMTYDKLSRALRQYYNEGIIAKVKGQKTTYKFDKLPYDYYPGVTRRRKSVHRRVTPSTAVHAGTYVVLTPQPFHSNSHLSVEEKNGSHNSTPPLIYPGQFPTPESSHSSSQVNNVQQNGSHNITLSLIYPGNFPTPESSHSSSPVNNIEQNGSQHIKPSLIYPGNFPTPELSHTSSPVNNIEQNGSHHVKPSLIYPGNFPTPELSHSSSPVNNIEQNGSQHVKPSLIYPGNFRTPETSHSSSPVNNVRQNGLHHVKPSIIYPGNFLTPESSHTSSPVNNIEQNGSQHVKPSIIYPGNFPTPESSHSSSPVNNIEQNGSQQVKPSFIYPWNFPTPEPSHTSSPVNNVRQNGLHHVKQSIIYPWNFRTPERSHSSSPVNNVEQNGLHHVKPSVIYPWNFPTPESPYSSSSLDTEEEDVSRSNMLPLCRGHFPTLESFQCVSPKTASRNNKPSVIYPGHFLRAPESPHLCSPPNNVGQSATFSASSASLTACRPVPFSFPDNVIWPTHVYPRVHTVPYQPLVYSVSVPYDPRPVITSVVGNYLEHPSNNSQQQI